MEGGRDAEMEESEIQGEREGRGREKGRERVRYQERKRKGENVGGKEGEQPAMLDDTTACECEKVR